MAEFGLTSFGFERPNLSQLVDNIKTDIQDRFGVDSQITDDSVFGQLATQWAERENEIWKMMEAVYHSQTYSGAEGVYLDDLYSKFGIYRRDKTPSSGFAYVETDNTAPNSYTISDTSTFTTTTGKGYTIDSGVILSTSLGAFKLESADIIATGLYTADMVDTATQITYIFNHTLVDLTDSSKFGLFTAISDFIKLHAQGNDERVYVDGTGIALYVGYNASFSSQIGLVDSISFALSPLVGTKYTKAPITANIAGYYPLPANSMKDLTPSFTGLIGVDNINPLFSGAEVESDAEFRARAEVEVDRTTGATRDAMLAALLSTTNVDSVRIYENTTPTDKPEALAYSFNCVIIGGSTDDISDTIYRAKPIQVSTSGSTSFDVDTEDGDVETIYHTKAILKALSVRVSYSSLTNTPLSSTEEQRTESAIGVTFSIVNIGQTIFIDMLKGNVFSSISPDRFTSLIVQLKEVDEPDSAYVDANYYPAFNELPTIVDGDIHFVQSS